MSELIELMDEAIEEDMEALNEVIKEDIEPLIKYRQDLEKKIFERAYKEVLELEEAL